MAEQTTPIHKKQQEKKTSTSAYKEYMKELQQWTYNYKCYHWMWNHYQSMQSYTLQMQMMNSDFSKINSSNPAQPPAPSTTTPTQPAQQPQLPPEYQIPSMMRRATAEVIDFLILLLLKTLGLLLVMRIYDMDGLFQKDGLLNIKLLKLLMDENEINEWLDGEEITQNQYDTLESDLSFLMGITLLYRFVTGVYEWLFIWWRGATPGKLVMRLKVITCTSVRSQRSGKIVVNPGTSVPSSNALTRSLIKNVMISLMIPAFLSAFFIPHRRTTYDEMSKTIVVR